MHSLKDKFAELCLRIDEGRRLESTGSDPIFYLVFPVSEILEVKRQAERSWIPKLENQGWTVFTFSFAETVNSILKNHRLRKTWLIGEKMVMDKKAGALSPSVIDEVNKTLSKALTEGTELLDMLLAKMEEAATHSDGLLLLTDLEALHPYLRINTIEAKIQDQIRCPVIVLYPGKREGKTSLRFLEFYPADPNYRSEHIG
jgi:hypothetical protein